ncbi:MAG: hypothetical protein IPM83_12820 [Ignavibacteria bacterium]|nr:hypothetical protein [Ignavibacteria bacterium]
MPIDLPNTVVKVSFGESHCVLLHSDGTLSTWGAGSLGRLGNGSESNSLDTFQKVPISDVVDVVCGQYHCVALKRDGTLWTWGMNSMGSLGIGRTPDRSLVPVHIDSVPPLRRSRLDGIFSLVRATPWHLIARDSCGLGETIMLGNSATGLRLLEECHIGWKALLVLLMLPAVGDFHVLSTVPGRFGHGEQISGINSEWTSGSMHHCLFD